MNRLERDCKWKKYFETLKNGNGKNNMDGGIRTLLQLTGGSFAYLRVELGDFEAFIASGNILLEYVVGCAAVARS